MHTLVLALAVVGVYHLYTTDFDLVETVVSRATNLVRDLVKAALALVKKI